MASKERGTYGRRRGEGRRCGGRAPEAGGVREGPGRPLTGTWKVGGLGGFACKFSEKRLEALALALEVFERPLDAHVRVVGGDEGGVTVPKRR